MGWSFCSLYAIKKIVELFSDIVLLSSIPGRLLIYSFPILHAD